MYITKIKFLPYFITTFKALITKSNIKEGF
jgi:hypothetical protein